MLASSVAPVPSSAAPQPFAKPAQGKPPSLAEYRDVIDLIATQRARALRIALFSTTLHRPDPDTMVEDRETLKDIDVQLDGMQKSLNLLIGGPTFETVSPVLKDWLKVESKKHETHVVVIKQLIKDAQGLRREILRKSPAAGRMIEAFTAQALGPFFKSVTAIIEALWISFEEMRHSELKRAELAIDAVSKTLSRLTHIGQHVRLVSLNASVESARVGDAARGLSVIAQEFKSLADEIQNLATAAQTDVNTLR